MWATAVFSSPSIVRRFARTNWPPSYQYLRLRWCHDVRRQNSLWPTYFGWFSDRVALPPALVPSRRQQLEHSSNYTNLWYSRRAICFARLHCRCFRRQMTARYMASLYASNTNNNFLRIYKMWRPAIEAMSQQLIKPTFLKKVLFVCRAQYLNWHSIHSSWARGFYSNSFVNKNFDVLFLCDLRVDKRHVHKRCRFFSAYKFKLTRLCNYRVIISGWIGKTKFIDIVANHRQIKQSRIISTLFRYLCDEFYRFLQYLKYSAFV